MELWEHIRLILGEHLIAAQDSDGIRVKYMDTAARESAHVLEDMAVKFASTFTDGAFKESEMRDLFRIYIKHNYGKE
jgi:hypothetical protein